MEISLNIFKTLNNLKAVVGRIPFGTLIFGSYFPYKVMVGLGIIGSAETTGLSLQNFFGNSLLL